MAVTLDPTQPVDSSSPTLGAADIRTLTGEVQQMFGGAGTAPVIYTVAPFIVDSTTGLATVPSNPTTGLGIATKQYVDASLLAASNFTGVATGTNTYAVTLTPVPTSYAAIAGLPVFVRIPNANSGASTINMNGLGAATIVKNGNVALTGGELLVGAWYLMIYDSTNTNVQIVGQINPYVPQVRVVKPTDQTLTSSTSLTNDSVLLFAIAASESWQFEFSIYTTYATAGGADIAVTAPSGAAIFYNAHPAIPTSSSAALTGQVTSGGRLQIAEGNGSVGTQAVSKVFGIVTNGATPGNVTLQFSQDASSGSATAIKANSSLLATRLAP